MPKTSNKAIRLFSLSKFDGVGHEGPILKGEIFETTKDRFDEILKPRGLARKVTSEDESEAAPAK